MATQDDSTSSAQGKQQRGLKPRRALPFGRRRRPSTARGLVIGLSAVEHVDQAGNEIEFAQGTGVHKI